MSPCTSGILKFVFDSLLQLD